MEDELNLIKCYFNDMKTNKEILRSLKDLHGIDMSSATLKRRLRMLDLKRCDNENHLVDAVDFIESDLKKAGQMLGYRMMHRKCRKRGLMITRDSVSLIQKTLDPKGVEERKKRKLRRRQYSVKGPNYLWHLDGYDKVKPYGIAVHGCVDGFARKVIWLEAASTNNDPKKIGNYYMDSIEKLGFVPVSIRSDYGNENKDVEIMQRLIREVYSESQFPAYLLGASTANQRIESFWAQLRKLYMQFYMNLFHELKDNGDFSGDDIDKSLIRFCFLKIIQKELDELKEIWDHHVIRKSKNSVMPAGKPEDMYLFPQEHGSRDYSVEVPEIEEIVSVLRNQFQYVDQSIDENLHLLCEMEVTEKGLTNSVDDPNINKELYLTLRPTIRSLLLDD